MKRKENRARREWMLHLQSGKHKHNFKWILRSSRICVPTCSPYYLKRWWCQCCLQLVSFASKCPKVMMLLPSHHILVAESSLNLHLTRWLLHWAALWPWPLPFLCVCRMMVLGVLTLVLSWTSLGADLATAVVSCYAFTPSLAGLPLYKLV